MLSIYVQDRAPSARFTGDSFVLPSTARRGIPLVTVNMDAADIKLFRIGDRSLAQLLSGYQFLRQIDGYDIDIDRRPDGRAGLEGRDSTSPTSSTRKSRPASRSTRRCPTASRASMC